MSANSNSFAKCVICKMLLYQDIAENSLTISGQHSQSKVVYYKKLVEAQRLRVIEARNTRILHLCDESHKQIASTLRTGHRKLKQEEIAKHRFAVETSLNDLKKWLLILGELKVKKASHISHSNGLRPILQSEAEKKKIFDIELSRAEAMVSHYRTLHSQRLRRLRESEAAKP